jgi:hypothetical protein
MRFNVNTKQPCDQFICTKLYFDYRYDDKIDNELIYKPDHSVNFDWMKKNGYKRKKRTIKGEES